MIRQRTDWMLVRMARAVLAAALCAGVPAWAEEADEGGSPIHVAGGYTLDLVAVAAGERTGFRRLDQAELAADVSLERLTGWRGARIFAHVMAGSGGEPNLLAGTVQGIDNIESTTHRIKLYQVYLEQSLPSIGGSLRAGLADLNEEFYASASSGLLLGPQFGIGSELAASGPAGPSIFPSTAAMARLRIERANRVYAQAAVYNAAAGSIGDRGGLRKLFGQGALLIAEAGKVGPTRMSLGGWVYTKRQVGHGEADAAGRPLRSRARGAYAIVEQAIPRLGETGAAFLRAGVSEGRTTPFRGGWQAGVMLAPLGVKRPGTQVSLGFHQAFLSRRWRLDPAQAGQRPGRRETGVELTIADAVTPFLTVQPDVQYIWRHSAGRLRDALVFTLRLTAGFP
jgi:porin